MAYAAAQPHDAIKQLAENLFVVHGSVMIKPIVRITRNMAVVRHQDELTLINAVRLDDAGLAALEALGTVKHLVRLGPFHGLDDPFYQDRYNTTFWSHADGTTYTEPKATRTLVDGGELPFPNAKLFGFSGLKETEGVILLEQGNGILLTVDALQSYSTPPHMPHTAWLTKKLMPLMGFPNETIVGPAWVKLMTEDQAALKLEFERLLEFDFDQLLSAHGTFLSSGAHQEVEAAVKKMFG